MKRYARVPGQKLVPLPGLPGSPEFMEAYQKAIAGFGEGRATIGASRTLSGTVSAALVAYYRDNSFAALAPGTRKSRRAILEAFRTEHGDKRLATLRRDHVASILGSKPPFAARNWLKAIRGLMQFFIAVGLRPDDPTAGLRGPKARAGSIHS